jgi:hypothetical protein
MAYPYVCDNCLDGKHDQCEGSRDVPSDQYSMLGGGFCICSHGGEESLFEKDRREMSRKSREARVSSDAPDKV